MSLQQRLVSRAVVAATGRAARRSGFPRRTSKAFSNSSLFPTKTPSSVFPLFSVHGADAVARSTAAAAAIAARAPAACATSHKTTTAAVVESSFAAVRTNVPHFLAAVAAGGTARFISAASKAASVSCVAACRDVVVSIFFNPAAATPASNNPYAATTARALGGRATTSTSPITARSLSVVGAAKAPARPVAAHCPYYTSSIETTLLLQSKRPPSADWNSSTSPPTTAVASAIVPVGRLTEAENTGTKKDREILKRAEAAATSSSQALKTENAASATAPQAHGVYFEAAVAAPTTAAKTAVIRRRSGTVKTEAAFSTCTTTRATEYKKKKATFFRFSVAPDKQSAVRARLDHASTFSAARTTPYELLSSADSAAVFSSVSASSALLPPAQLVRSDSNAAAAAAIAEVADQKIITSAAAAARKAACSYQCCNCFFFTLPIAALFSSSSRHYGNKSTKCSTPHSKLITTRSTTRSNRSFSTFAVGSSSSRSADSLSSSDKESPSVNKVIFLRFCRESASRAQTVKGSSCCSAKIKGSTHCWGRRSPIQKCGRMNSSRKRRRDKQIPNDCYRRSIADVNRKNDSESCSKSESSNSSDSASSSKTRKRSSSGGEDGDEGVHWRGISNLRLLSFFYTAASAIAGIAAFLLLLPKLYAAAAQQQQQQQLQGQWKRRGSKAAAAAAKSSTPAAAWKNTDSSPARKSSDSESTENDHSTAKSRLCTSSTSSSIVETTSPDSSTSILFNNHNNRNRHRTSCSETSTSNSTESRSEDCSRSDERGVNALEPATGPQHGVMETVVLQQQQEEPDSAATCADADRAGAATPSSGVFSGLTAEKTTAGCEAAPSATLSPTEAVVVVGAGSADTATVAAAAGGEQEGVCLREAEKNTESFLQTARLRSPPLTATRTTPAGAAGRGPEAEAAAALHLLPASELTTERWWGFLVSSSAQAENQRAAASQHSGAAACYLLAHALATNVAWREAVIATCPSPSAFSFFLQQLLETAASSTNAAAALAAGAAATTATEAKKEQQVQEQNKEQKSPTLSFLSALNFFSQTGLVPNKPSSVPTPAQDDDAEATAAKATAAKATAAKATAGKATAGKATTGKATGAAALQAGSQQYTAAALSALAALLLLLPPCGSTEKNSRPFSDISSLQNWVKPLRRFPTPGCKRCNNYSNRNCLASCLCSAELRAYYGAAAVETAENRPAASAFRLLSSRWLQILLECPQRRVQVAQQEKKQQQTEELLVLQEWLHADCSRNKGPQQATNDNSGSLFRSTSSSDPFHCCSIGNLENSVFVCDAANMSSQGEHGRIAAGIRRHLALEFLRCALCNHHAPEKQSESAFQRKQQQMSTTPQSLHHGDIGGDSEICGEKRSVRAALCDLVRLLFLLPAEQQHVQSSKNSRFFCCSRWTTLEQQQWLECVRLAAVQHLLLPAADASAAAISAVLSPPPPSSSWKFASSLFRSSGTDDSRTNNLHKGSQDSRRTSTTETQTSSSSSSQKPSENSPTTTTTAARVLLLRALCLQVQLLLPTSPVPAAACLAELIAVAAAAAAAQQKQLELQKQTSIQSEFFFQDKKRQEESSEFQKNSLPSLSSGLLRFTSYRFPDPFTYCNNATTTTATTTKNTTASSIYSDKNSDGSKNSSRMDSCSLVGNTNSRSCRIEGSDVEGDSSCSRFNKGLCCCWEPVELPLASEVIFSLAVAALDALQPVVRKTAASESRISDSRFFWWSSLALLPQQLLQLFGSSRKPEEAAAAEQQAELSRQQSVVGVPDSTTTVVDAALQKQDTHQQHSQLLGAITEGNSSRGALLLLLLSSLLCETVKSATLVSSPLHAELLPQQHHQWLLNASSAKKTGFKSEIAHVEAAAAASARRAANTAAQATAAATLSAAAAVDCDKTADVLRWLLRGKIPLTSTLISDAGLAAVEEDDFTSVETAAAGAGRLVVRLALKAAELVSQKRQQQQHCNSNSTSSEEEYALATLRYAIRQWMSRQSVESQHFHVWLEEARLYALQCMQLLLVEDLIDRPARAAAAAFFDGDADSLLLQTFSSFNTGNSKSSAAARSSGNHINGNGRNESLQSSKNCTCNNNRDKDVSQEAKFATLLRWLPRGGFWWWPWWSSAPPENVLPIGSTAAVHHPPPVGAAERDKAAAATTLPPCSFQTLNPPFPLSSPTFTFPNTSYSAAATSSSSPLAEHPPTPLVPFTTSTAPSAAALQPLLQSPIGAAATASDGTPVLHAGAAAAPILPQAQPSTSPIPSTPPTQLFPNSRYSSRISTAPTMTTPTPAIPTFPPTPTTKTPHYATSTATTGTTATTPPTLTTGTTATTPTPTTGTTATTPTTPPSNPTAINTTTTITTPRATTGITATTPTTPPSNPPATNTTTITIATTETADNFTTTTAPTTTPTTTGATTATNTSTAGILSTTTTTFPTTNAPATKSPINGISTITTTFPPTDATAIKTPINDISTTTPTSPTTNVTDTKTPINNISLTTTVPTTRTTTTELTAPFEGRAVLSETDGDKQKTSVAAGGGGFNFLNIAADFQTFFSSIWSLLMKNAASGAATAATNEATHASFCCAIDAKPQEAATALLLKSIATAPKTLTPQPPFLPSLALKIPSLPPILLKVSPLSQQLLKLQQSPPSSPFLLKKQEQPPSSSSSLKLLGFQQSPVGVKQPSPLPLKVPPPILPQILGLQQSPIFPLLVGVKQPPPSPLLLKVQEQSPPVPLRIGGVEQLPPLSPLLSNTQEQPRPSSILLGLQQEQIPPPSPVLSKLQEQSPPVPLLVGVKQPPSAPLLLKVPPLSSQLLGFKPPPLLPSPLFVGVQQRPLFPSPLSLLGEPQHFLPVSTLPEPPLLLLLQPAAAEAVKKAVAQEEKSTSPSLLPTKTGFFLEQRDEKIPQKKEERLAKEQTVAEEEEQEKGAIQGGATRWQKVWLLPARFLNRTFFTIENDAAVHAVPTRKAEAGGQQQPLWRHGWCMLDSKYPSPPSSSSWWSSLWTTKTDGERRGSAVFSETGCSLSGSSGCDDSELEKKCESGSCRSGGGVCGDVARKKEDDDFCVGINTENNNNSHSPCDSAAVMVARVLRAVGEVAEELETEEVQAESQTVRDAVVKELARNSERREALHQVALLSAFSSTSKASSPFPVQQLIAAGVLDVLWILGQKELLLLLRDPAALRLYSFKSSPKHIPLKTAPQCGLEPLSEKTAAASSVNASSCASEKFTENGGGPLVLGGSGKGAAAARAQSLLHWFQQQAPLDSLFFWTSRSVNAEQAASAENEAKKRKAFLQAVEQTRRDREVIWNELKYISRIAANAAGVSDSLFFFSNESDNNRFKRNRMIEWHKLMLQVVHEVYVHPALQSPIFFFLKSKIPEETLRLAAPSVIYFEAVRCLHNLSLSGLLLSEGVSGYNKSESTRERNFVKKEENELSPVKEGEKKQQEAALASQLLPQLPAAAEQKKEQSSQKQLLLNEKRKYLSCVYPFSIPDVPHRVLDPLLLLPAPHHQTLFFVGPSKEAFFFPQKTAAKTSSTPQPFPLSFTFSLLFQSPHGDNNSSSGDGGSDDKKNKDNDFLTSGEKRSPQLKSAAVAKVSLLLRDHLPYKPHLPTQCLTTQQLERLQWTALTTVVGEAQSASEKETRPQTALSGTHRHCGEETLSSVEASAFADDNSSCLNRMQQPAVATTAKNAEKKDLEAPFVIFLHGLRGSAWRTWRSSSCADELLLLPPEQSLLLSLNSSSKEKTTDSCGPFNSSSSGSLNGWTNSCTAADFESVQEASSHKPLNHSHTLERGKTALPSAAAQSNLLRDGEAAKKINKDHHFFTSPSTSSTVPVITSMRGEGVCSCRALRFFEEPENLNSLSESENFYFLWPRQLLAQRFPSCSILAVDYQAPLFRRRAPFYRLPVRAHATAPRRPACDSTTQKTSASQVTTNQAPTTITTITTNATTVTATPTTTTAPITTASCKTTTTKIANSAGSATIAKLEEDGLLESALNVEVSSEKESSQHQILHKKNDSTDDSKSHCTSTGSNTSSDHKSTSMKNSHNSSCYSHFSSENGSSIEAIPSSLLLKSSRNSKSPSDKVKSEIDEIKKNEASICAADAAEFAGADEAAKNLLEVMASRDTEEEPTLLQLGKCVHEQLVAAGVGKGSKPIVFVVHSMGGLLAEFLLLNDKNIRKNTKAILFFSTPHLGSPLAEKEWLRLVVKPLLPLYVQQLSPVDASLRALSSAFSQLINSEEGKHIKIAALGELRPTPLPYIGGYSLIVPPWSSLPDWLHAKPSLLVNVNHSQICKPATTRDIRFQILEQLVRAAYNKPDI